MKNDLQEIDDLATRLANYADSLADDQPITKADLLAAVDIVTDYAAIKRQSKAPRHTQEEIREMLARLLTEPLQTELH